MNIYSCIPSRNGNVLILLHCLLNHAMFKIFSFAPAHRRYWEVGVLSIATTDLTLLHHLQCKISKKYTTSKSLFSMPSTHNENNNDILNDRPPLSPVGESSKRLFLVRHGEVINPGGKDRPVFYGAMDVPLSSIGKKEANAAGRYLRSYDLDVVACSPLSRAVFGAEQILDIQKNTFTNNNDSSPIKFNGFMELDRGSWCGLTKNEIGQENMSRFNSCDETATPTNGESLPFLKDRVLSARDELLQKIPNGGSAAVVSHLQVTRCILSDALGIPTSEMSNLGIATASITCIDYDDTQSLLKQTIHFRNFKPNIGLRSFDGAN